MKEKIQSVMNTLTALRIMMCDTLTFTEIAETLNQFVENDSDVDIMTIAITMDTMVDSFKVALKDIVDEVTEEQESTNPMENILKNFGFMN